MLSLQKLLNIQSIILNLFKSYFKLNNSSFIVVKVAVVRGWKYCYNCWKLFSSSPMIHFKSIGLSLMSSNYWKKAIFLEESFWKFISKIIWTSSCIVFLNDWFHFACIIINWISPHQIAKGATFRNLLESIDLFNIFYLQS